MILVPSILAADFGSLGEQIARAERGGAGAIHVDVMDGHFVPNLTMGPAIVAAVRKATRLPLDVHLMIEEPDRYLETFVEAGASWVSVHVEAATHLQRTITQIKKLGARAGVAVNPATPLTAVEEILPDADYVLLMTVNPGFSGQPFLPHSYDKLRRLRRNIQERGLACQIEVDGGVDLANIRALVEAGAELVVAGSAVFGKEDPEQAARALVDTGR